MRNRASVPQCRRVDAACAIVAARRGDGIEIAGISSSWPRAITVRGIFVNPMPCADASRPAARCRRRFQDADDAADLFSKMADADLATTGADLQIVGFHGTGISR
jgi:hypothetical protein